MQKQWGPKAGILGGGAEFGRDQRVIRPERAAYRPIRLPSCRSRFDTIMSGFFCGIPASDTRT